jgi:hypothetical protein
VISRNNMISVIHIRRRSILLISPRGFELLTLIVFHYITESIWLDPYVNEVFT